MTVLSRTGTNLGAFLSFCVSSTCSAFAFLLEIFACSLSTGGTVERLTNSFSQALVLCV